MSLGTLYLIPVPLAENAEEKSYTLYRNNLVNRIDEYIVENERTARRFLKKAGITTPQNQLKMHDYGKHVRKTVDYNTIFKPIMGGKDMGLMSESGCPGIADPGADVVAEAHRRGIKVVPLVGPNSVLLALMASGFNGQKFAFHGYLPINKNERVKRIRDLEHQSQREGQTQIFIETPFRNDTLMSDLLKTLKSNTEICVASNITGPEEKVTTLSTAEWKSQIPVLHKKPTIFLIYVQN